MAPPILTGGELAMLICGQCKKLIKKKTPIELFDETKNPPVLVGEYCSRACAINAAADWEAMRERSKLVPPPPLSGKGRLPVEW